jgi:PAS domain S-box-containing protein
MTTPSKSLVPEALATEYGSALRDYVRGAGEAALVRAYELGRKAATSGLGILDLTMLHHQAVAQLPQADPVDRAPVAMAAQFLAESLSPYEMTLRSYQANARLLGLSETLAQQNAEMSRAREQLRLILDATTAVIYLKDAAGRYLFVNRQFQEVFGRGGEDVIGKADEEVLPPAVARTLQSDDRLVLDARAPHELEETIRVGDGERTYISLKFPLLDGEGAPYGICCVATDITERKRADEALQRARDASERERQLRRAIEAREQFLSIASHELKTPLTSLELQVGSLQRLARSSPGAPFSDERVQSKCEVILRQVERLKVLMNSLMDVGRITSGRLELTRERVDLAELVRLVLARWEEAIRRSGSAVALGAPAPVVGTWDRRLVETVVAHLVSNAVKFGCGRPIEIAVGAARGRASLTVRDHGIGVPAPDQQRIFERFERAVSEHHFGGFGVGLWVARQAVEAHGGEIRLRSHEGEGAEFSVELPLEDEGTGHGRE